MASSLEPHIFCGPEFILEVPAGAVEGVLTCLNPGNEGTSSPQATLPAHPNTTNTSTNSNTNNNSTTTATNNSGVHRALSGAGWLVSPDCLLDFQTELLALCRVVVRRRLHRDEAFPLSSSPQALVYPSEALSNAIGPPPEPPSRLIYLTAKPFAGLSAEESAAVLQSVQTFHRHPKFSGEKKGDDDEGKVKSTREEKGPLSLYFLLYITDSRLAAEVYEICLRNGSISLSRQCRVFSYFRSTAIRLAPVNAMELLRKREALRRRWNLDEDLFSTMEAAMKEDPAVEEVKKRAMLNSSDLRVEGGMLASSPFLRRDSVEHLARITALLNYCESHVQYASVLDAEEKASPFLIAMGLFFDFELTIRDIYTHFIRHPRRLVRAVGLFLVRYLLPPEELPPFFYPSLQDGVAIACAVEFQTEEPILMKELCRKLLLESEVGEAWLPVYHKFWINTVIEPALAHMERYRQQQEKEEEERRQNQLLGRGKIMASVEEKTIGIHPDEGKGEEVKGRKDQEDLKGSGRGVGALGFRSIAHICQFARQKRERTLLPQRMVTLVARTQRRDFDSNNYNNNRRADKTLRKLQAAEDALLSGSDLQDSDSADEEGDDGFLIPVNVEGGEEKEEEEGAEPLSRRHPINFSRKEEVTKSEKTSRAAGLSSSNTTAAKAPLVEQAKRVQDEVVNPHMMILKEGYRLVLSLLNRTRPFHEDERYLEF